MPVTIRRFLEQWASGSLFRWVGGFGTGTCGVCT